MHKAFFLICSSNLWLTSSTWDMLEVHPITLCVPTRQRAGTFKSLPEIYLKYFWKTFHCAPVWAETENELNALCTRRRNSWSCVDQVLQKPMGRQLSVHFVANSRLAQYLLCQHDIGAKEVAPPPCSVVEEWGECCQVICCPPRASDVHFRRWPLSQPRCGQLAASWSLLLH